MIDIDSFFVFQRQCLENLLHEQQVRDVDSPVGISVEQVPDTAADTAVNDDADEGLHEGSMATDDNHQSGKYDAPCSVDVAG